MHAIPLDANGDPGNDMPPFFKDMQSIGPGDRIDDKMIQDATRVLKQMVFSRQSARRVSQHAPNALAKHSLDESAAIGDDTLHESNILNLMNEFEKGNNPRATQDFIQSLTPDRDAASLLCPYLRERLQKISIVKKKCIALQKMRYPNASRPSAMSRAFAAASWRAPAVSLAALVRIVALCACRPCEPCLWCRRRLWSPARAALLAVLYTIPIILYTILCKILYTIPIIAGAEVVHNSSKTPCSHTHFVPVANDCAVHTAL